MNTEKLLEWHEDYLDEIRQRGIADGKMNQPHSDDTILSPYEKKIRANYLHKAAELKNSYTDKLAEVSEDKESALREQLEVIKVKNPEQRLNQAEINKVAELKKEKDRNAEEMKRLENHPAYMSAKLNVRKVMSKFNKKSKDLKRSYTDKQLPTWAYFLIMTFIAIGEIAFNFAAFEGLGDNKAFALISAVGVNFGLVVVFHVIGDFIKRRKEVKNALFGAFLLLVICISVIAGMSHIREGDEFELFFAIGCMLMAVGITMSWLNHDSSGEFAHMLKDKGKAEQKLIKETDRVNNLKTIENKRWDEANKRIASEYESFVKNVTDEVQNKKNEISSFLIRRQSINAEYQERLSEVNSLFHVAVQTYREENYEHRNDTKQVLVWEKEVENLKI